MRNFKIPSILLPIAVMAPLSFASAAEYTANSAKDIVRLLDNAKPGDTLIMAEGTWQDQAIVLRGKGTEKQPITLRAAVPGKTVLTGKSSIAVEGEYLVVSGLLLKDNTAAGDSISLSGNHCRLTETAVIGGTSKFFVHLRGTSNRVDHCYVSGKTSEGPTMQVEVDEQPNYHLIEFNHFGPRPPLGQNGGETMRVGYSHQSMRNSRATVSQNLFDRCDGELEIISNKSCENVYRANTFLDCSGMLTLRHGNRCRVDGNFFFGHGKKASGGIRIIGEDHVIVNNYIDDVTRGGFWITSGVPDSALNGYFRARNILIAFNTVVNSHGPYLELDSGFGTSNRSLRPENITVANNLFALPEDGTLLSGTEGEGFKWLGNLSSTLPAPHGGIRVANLKLNHAADGLLRPGPESPAHNAAQGDFAQVKSDIDGQMRQQLADVGCDEVSNEAIVYRPLQGYDVGPTWLKDRP